MTDMPIQTILLATDLSARCDRATERAISLAQHWNARLHVLTVIDPVVDDAKAVELAEAEARRNTGIRLKGYSDAIVHVQIGAVEARVADLAREVNADLIVTGPSGTQWLGQTILGGTLKFLMRRAHVPVLLVKKPVTRDYRRVMVSMDLSDASRAPVETAFRTFGRSVSLSMFHAFRTPYRLFSGDTEAYEAGMRDGVTLEIRDALKAWNIETAEHLPVIADYGDPATKLAELVDKHDVDLVVTGTHGRTGLLNLMLGSVAEAIVETVTCDVLVVPSRGAWPD